MWALLSGFFKSLSIILGMAQAKEQRNEGAIAQREKDDADELQTLRDDRARLADDALRQRVRNDHETDGPA